MGEGTALWLRMLAKVKRARRLREWEDYLSRQKNTTGTTANTNCATVILEFYL